MFNTTRLLLCIFLFLGTTVGCERNQKSRPIKTHTQLFPITILNDKKDRGLENVLKITDDLFSGGEPQGDRAFSTLAEMGIKTIVSVDGAVPDIEAAREHGLRYVHIPIGYDGVQKHAGDSLAQLMRQNNVPIYVHCHHGKHRGPTAAAIACLATKKITNQQALEILKKAGTSENYSGLWHAVKNYRVPPEDAALPDLVEQAKVSSLSSAMASIDRAFDHLQLCRQSQWKTPETHPDLVAKQEALLLYEAFHEANRHLSGEQDAAFKAMLKESEKLSSQLHQAMQAKNASSAQKNLQALSKLCQQCHKAYRN